MDSRKSGKIVQRLLKGCSSVFLFALVFSSAYLHADEEVVSLEEADIVSEIEQKKDRISTIFSPSLSEDPLYAFVDEDRVVIDLSNEMQALGNLYTDIDFQPLWLLSGLDEPIEGDVFDVSFSKTGDRAVTFQLFEEAEDGEVLLFEFEVPIFVYRRSIPSILFTEGDQQVISQAHDAGILLYPLYSGSRDLIDANGENMYEAYLKYFQDIRGPRGDFILVNGGRSEGVDAIHAMYLDMVDGGFTDQSQVSFVFVTEDNLKKTSDIASIFLSGKTSIGQILITSRDSQSLVHEAETLGGLAVELGNRGYDHVSLFPAEQEIAWYRFVSRFTNTLTNEGMDREMIYLFLMIPFLLTGVVIFRHLLGFGGIGILLPVFLTYLCFTETWYIIVGLYVFFFFINVFVSRFFRGYAMLYVPRIAFILTVNMAFFILLWVITKDYGLELITSMSLIPYMIFFFLMERTIALIWSKDFGEYYPTFLNTIAFVILMYGFFSLGFMQQFILGTPEVILVLIFVNFLFGRYKGLRLTEYFRFWDLFGREFEEE